jgi:uncharacterized protein YjbI with pentapeptide repeats
VQQTSFARADLTGAKLGDFNISAAIVEGAVLP